MHPAIPYTHSPSICNAGVGEQILLDIFCQIGPKLQEDRYNCSKKDESRSVEEIEYRPDKCVIVYATAFAVFHDTINIM